MTELKDGIKKITSSWGKDNGLEFLVTTDEMDDLAQHIADSLVVDEEQLQEITCNACGCGYCDTCRRIIKAIASAKPIKCEVGSD